MKRTYQPHKRRRARRFGFRSRTRQVLARRRRKRRSKLSA